MSSLPAQFLGLRDRGLIRESMKADIVVFDPDGVKNNATFKNPCSHPDGIPYVLVNGVLTVFDGRHTGALAGQVLKR